MIILDHVCVNEDRFSKIEQRVSVVETKVDNVREDIKEIKESQSKLQYWIIGTLATAMITLFTLLINIMRGTP